MQVMLLMRRYALKVTQPSISLAKISSLEPFTRLVFSQLAVRSRRLGLVPITSWSLRLVLSSRSRSSLVVSVSTSYSVFRPVPSSRSRPGAVVLFVLFSLSRSHPGPVVSVPPYRSHRSGPAFHSRCRGPVPAPPSPSHRFGIVVSVLSSRSRRLGTVVSISSRYRCLGSVVLFQTRLHRFGSVVAVPSRFHGEPPAGTGRFVGFCASAA